MPGLTPTLRRFRNAAIVLLSPILFLALLEGGLRLINFGYPAAFWVPVEGRPADQTNRYFGRRFFSPALARMPEPVRLAKPKPLGSYRIFVVGGSAAMGFPEPGLSFGRILEILLENRYPRTDFEVVNAAMTAINSHAVLPIVQDSAKRQPDAFVVYLGNNEVVGPYGPGTVFAPAVASPPLLRWAIRIGGMRTGQLLRRAISFASKERRQPQIWLGMEMFVERRVAADDPRLERVYASFEANLGSIVRTAGAAGAKVLLCTVAVNLRDSPPFASGPADDGASAEGLFLTAQTLAEQGRHPEALQKFRSARDMDELRFRADSRINQVIRDTARRFRSKDAHLVDAEAVFAAASPGGAPGGEFFFEHVHFRFAGAWKLAESVAARLAPLLPADIRLAGDSAERLSASQVAQQLAYSAWDRWRLENRIYELMERPPFTMQAGHADRMKQLAATIAELRSAADPRQARQAYERALSRRPEDLSLRRRYAELLAAAGDYEASAAQWRRLLEQLPQRPSWLAALGAALRAAGRSDEAAEQYRAALDQDPQFAEAEFGLGVVLQAEARLEEARRRYKRALELNPRYVEAENNLGLLRMQEGDLDAALEAFSRAADLDPGFAPARFHLGSALASQGRFAEASPHFEEALRQQPEYAEAAAGLGATFAAQRKFDRALELYQQAVRLNPRLAEAQFNLAKLYELRGDRDSAIKRYHAALDARPDYLEALNNLGIALSRSGQTQEGAKLFERALAIDPNFAPARANLERLRP